MSRITEHLDEAEYFCHCGCGAPPDYDANDMPPCYDYLFDCFETIRAEYGKPLVVTSGYRCLKRNKEVGGGDLSAHLFGLAIDIQVPTQEDADKLFAVIRRACPELRVGREKYRGEGKPIVHIDNAWQICPRPTSNFAEGVTW